MKRIYQLQNLLNIVIWGSFIVMGIAVLFLLFAFISGDYSNIGFIFNGEKTNHLDMFQVIVTLFYSIGYLFFFMAIFKLKSLVTFFAKKSFFTESTINLSKKTGWFLLLSTAFLYLPPFIYESFTAETTKISLKAVSPESFLFLIVIGLFFLTLSAIFQEAKHAKEENELTV